MEARVTKWQLRQRQSLPLEAKLMMTKERIREWHTHWDEDVYVAFSGGLDSTVLRHITLSLYPDMPCFFFNTGLEYPEIVEFVKSVGNIQMIRPKLSFRQVLEKYGFPVISKRVAQYIHEVQRSNGETATKRLRLTGIRSDGSKLPMAMIPQKWQYLCEAPFRVSDRCCYALKKNPAKRVETERGLKPILGTRVEESSQREQTYYMHGCNAFDLKRPRSTPLAFWLHADVEQYIKEHNLPYSKIYDMGYDRTGCMFCMFGAHLEKTPNRFQRMRETHPKQYRYCIEILGLGKVLDYIGVRYGEYDEQLALF